MALPQIQKYSNHEFPFPNRSIDPALKTEKYCKQWAEGIYSLFLSGKCAWPLSRYVEFDELRAYSTGNQSTDKYKAWLTGSDTEDATVDASAFDTTPLSRISKREGWANVMFENLSPLPKIMNSIHGMFDKIDFNLYVDTIDRNSQSVAEDEMYRKFFETQNIDWQNEYKKNAGIPIDEDVFFPKSIEEFNMYKAKGGYKLNVAIAMQKLLRYSFDISAWDTVVRKKVIDDLICVGYGAIRDYFDAEDNKWKIKWIDPAKLVIQFSNEYDYSDSEYAGYFNYWTISNLKLKLPNVQEKEWKSLAQNCYGLYGNVGHDWNTWYSELDPSGTYRYDGFKVPVFETEWIDTDTKKRLYYKSRYGRNSTIDIGYDSEIKELTEAQKSRGMSQTVKNIFVRQPYQCSWVIGTDYVFDSGPINMASRKGYSKPQLTFHVEQLLQPSIIKRLKPIEDQIVLIWLRHQNSMAMMIERGYAVNMTMLGNVSLGGQKLSISEVIKLWRQTGVLPYAYSGLGTGLYTGGAALPVTPIEGGLGTRVEETAKSLEIQFKLIEEIVGINPLTLGSSPDPNAPVSTTEAALQATSNVLKPIMDACFEIKESAGTALMRRIQVGIRNSQDIRDGYEGVISSADMQALKMMENEGVQYGMALKAKPDSKAKATFAKWIDISLANTREQRPGLDMPDAIYFNEKLESGGDLQEIAEELRYVIEKNKKEAQKNQLEVIERQGQVNMQAEQAKTQGQIALQQDEAKSKQQEEVIRGQVKSLLQQELSNDELLKQAYLDMIASESFGTVNTARP